MLDQSATLEAFLAATAARQPAPGGGSVTALTGATAAALAEMVLNYSIGKKDLAAHQDELKEVLAELTRARQMFLRLMLEDQAAYEAFSAARKMPDSPQRKPALAAALKTCIDIPSAAAAAALALLTLCDRVRPKVNPHLLSDLAIAADLAMTTVRCSIHNVRVNLAELDSRVDREKIEQANQHMLEKALESIIRFSRRAL